MQSAPIFALLQRYVLPVFLEIPPCPPEKSGCEHMGVGHKLACEFAFHERAYAAVLTPDCVLSDGTISYLQEFARSGIELVLAAALRFGEEPFFARLRERGVLRDDAPAGEPLTIPNRDMVYAAVHGFHSHSASCEYGSSYYPLVPHCAWWRVPGEDGIVLYSLSWAPLLIDYATFEGHDTTTMDRWTIDGDYIYKNLDRIKRIHLITDSDEGFIASWAPLEMQETRQTGILKPSWIGRPAWSLQFIRAFHSSFFDPFKRKMFFRPVRWHSRPLDASKWSPVEEQSMRLLCEFLPRPVDGQGDAPAAVTKPKVEGAAIGAAALQCLRVMTLSRLALAALCGDRYARLSIIWHLRRNWYQFRERPFSELPPTRA